MARSYKVTSSVVAFHAHTAQAVFGQAGQGAVGVVFLHLGQGGAGAIPLLEFVVGVADLEQGVGGLGAFRVLVEQILEGGQRNVVIARDVVGLTQPVLRVVGIVTVRLGIEERLD